MDSKKYYKNLLSHVNYLNETMKNGTKDEYKKAKQELKKLLHVENPQINICMVRKIENKYKVRHTYISNKTDIDDGDICVIYKLKKP